MAKKSVKYEGVLSEQMDPEKGPDQIHERLHALVDHYDRWTDSGDVDWLGLTMDLAGDHVPGFRFQKRKGRKPGATMTDAVLLGVITYRMEQGKKIQNICHELAGTKPFENRSAEYLRKRYYELKNGRDRAATDRVAEFLRDLRNYDPND